MTDTRILLFGASPSETLTKVLGKPGRALTQLTDADRLAAAAAEQDVVVIDVVPPPHSIVELCRQLRGSPDLGQLPILAITSVDDVEERIKLLEAGADDVMIRPLDERELDARVEALDLRSRRSRELRPSTVVAATKRPGRRLIAVYSPKGGVGTTTVAVNLGLAVAVRDPEGAALVDLTPMGGHVATHLDLRPRLTIADLLRDSQGLISPEILKSTYLQRHERGLLVLAGSPAPSPADLMTGDDAERILEAVLTAVPTVVVDLGSHLDDRVLASLETADDVVLVVTPDFPALKSVHSFFEFLAETGKAPEPTVVVNEVYALQTLTPADIENALGRRVAMRVPYDPLLYLRAANQGTPVFAGAPTSQPARRYDQLAGILLGEDAPGGAPDQQRRRGLAGIFGRS